MIEAAADSVTSRSTPTVSNLSHQASRANLGSAGRLPRTGSAASVASSSGDRIERELQTGARTVVNGIAFPTVVAKKIPGSLLRVSKYSVNPSVNTLMLTCFVDLYLDPPRPQLAPNVARLQPRGTPSLDGSTSEGILSRGPATPMGGGRPTSRDLNNRQVSFFAEPKTAEKANPLSRIGRTTSPKSSPKSLRAPASGVDPFGFVQDLPDDSGDDMAMDELHQSNSKAASTVPPADARHQPRGPYIVRIPNHVTVAEATTLVHQYLRKKQQQELNEVRESQQSTAAASPGSSSKTLFGQLVDVDKAVESIRAVPKKLQALNANAVSLLSLATMDEIPEQHRTHLGGEEDEDGGTVRLTLRPCDPLGHVLDRASADGTLAPRKTILSCFPKGCTSFFVCLAPDPEQERQRIRSTKLHELREQQEAQAKLQRFREGQVEEKERARRASEASALRHSVNNDIVLRRDMFRPKGSIAYKAFVKGEVHDDKRRQREQDEAQVMASRDAFRREAEEGWLRYFMSIKHVEESCADAMSGVSIEESRDRQKIVEMRNDALLVQRREERCSVLRREIHGKVEAARQGSSPFAGWSL